MVWWQIVQLRTKYSIVENRYTNIDIAYLLVGLSISEWGFINLLNDMDIGQVFWEDDNTARQVFNMDNSKGGKGHAEVPRTTKMFFINN